MSKSAETLFSGAPSPLRVGLLVLPETNTLAFAATVDPMRAANRRAGKRLFDWSFHVPGGHDSALTSGLSVTGTPLTQLDRCDLLIVIAGFNVETHLSPALLAGLRRLHGGGAALFGVDGGTWALAKSGLLDGERATTHWEDLDDMASRFDRITFERSRYVISGRLLTSSGALPTLDLMLTLIAARHSPALADEVAGVFLHHPVGDRPQPRARRHVASLPAAITRAITLMETHIEDPMTITALAQACAVSPRHLEHLFQTHLGKTPKGYYLALRLAEAHRLILETAEQVQSVALLTGFSSQAGFARAFRKHHGCSARDLRATQAQRGRHDTGFLPPVGKDRMGAG